MEWILTGDRTLTSLPACNLATCTKHQALDYFENSYSLTETLFSSLKDESTLYLVPDRLRLPLIFYLVHPAVVYVNKLMLAGLITERIDQEMETMFETGVDEMSWDDTEHYRLGGSYVWPPVRRCVEYRATVRTRIRSAINLADFNAPIDESNPWWALFLGCEHERIHVETSSVLIRQLPAGLAQRPIGWRYAPPTAGEGAPVRATMIDVAGGRVTLGKPRGHPTFGWDNEYGERVVSVPPHQVSSHLVTNREFLSFVRDGGYEGSGSWWGTEGRCWRAHRGARHPTFWVCGQGCRSGCGGGLANYSHCQPRGGATANGGGASDGDEFRLRLMFDEVPMMWDWPVEVNYHEAAAYCVWRGDGARLLTESEHRLLTLSDNSADYDGGDQKSYNLGLSWGSPTPVNAYPPSGNGAYDVRGNVWSWVMDDYNGLPGFRTNPLYDDFSSPCFDGKHTLILGGSWVSTGCVGSQSARFAFRRHFFQHLGFRVARSMPAPTSATSAESSSSSSSVISSALASKLPATLKGVESSNGEMMSSLQAPSSSTASSSAPSPSEGGCPVMLVRRDGVPPEDYTRELMRGLSPVVEPSRNGQTKWESNDMLRLQFLREFPARSDATGDSRSYPEIIVASCAALAKRHRSPTHNGGGDVGGVGGDDSALVLGSALGMTSFLLSAKYSNVLGIDFCSRFVDTAEKIRGGATGIGGHPPLSEPPPSALTHRVTFKQLTWIPNEVGVHDLVLVDFLDRTVNPAAWLLRLWELVSPGGIIVISSATWDEDRIQVTLTSSRKRMTLLEALSLRWTEASVVMETRVSAWRSLSPRANRHPRETKTAGNGEVTHNGHGLD